MLSRSLHPQIREDSKEKHQKQRQIDKQHGEPYALEKRRSEAKPHTRKQKETQEKARESKYRKGLSRKVTDKPTGTE